MKDNIEFIKSLYLKFLVSSTLAMLGSIVGQLANNILIGNVIGPDILSVSSIVLPIYYVYASLGALIGVGAAAVSAKFMGQNDVVSANKAFSAAFLMTILFASALSVIMLVNLEKLITFLGATANNYTEVYAYARIMILGGIFTMGMYPVFNFLRLDGKSAASVICFLIMGSVNILLNILFLFTFDMGMAGVSLATSLGSACACGFGCFLLFFKSKNFKLHRPNGFIKMAARIFTTGSPAAIENVSIALRSFCLNIIIVSSFNTLALSSFSILNSVNSVAIVLIAGICGTIIPFVGVFYEEKDTKSIKQILLSAFVLGGTIIIVFSAFCMLFPAVIASIFGMKSTQQLHMSVSTIVAFSLSLAPCMVNNIFISVYTATGRTMFANLLTAAHSFVFIVITAYSMVKPAGINGIWHSFWIAEIAAMLLILIYHISVRLKNKNLSFLTLIDTTAEKEGRFISFSVKNDMEDIVNCSTQISEFCEANKLNQKNAMLISLALEEMLVLIKQHSLKDSRRSVNVRILVHNEMIMMRLRNAGIEFNPISFYEARQQNKDINSDSFDESLGISMILPSAKDIFYQCTFGVNNLTIVL